ncbi:SRR1-like protein [Trichogramma pretiosum]|uniref:SRR1-like protein n=1 Tax=Trichogramma pretiosum TaxID=7493 RepID=UPI0006C95D28|nr:SRR1-like protein [Trichogramma pretiosum]
MNDLEDSGEFQVVKHSSRNKRRNNRPRVNSKFVADNKVVDNNVPVEEIFEKVQAASQKFHESPFRQTLLYELNKALRQLDSKGIIDIVCYGLGNFSEFNCPKYQLAALLTVKSTYSANVFVYDPLFTNNESQCLKLLNLNVIENNEEGKRLIQNHTTLVFMPHCSKQLINNFLYTNWSPLIKNCILLGNSWSDIECHTTDALFQQTIHYMYKLKPYVTEIKLQNNFQYPNTFSGTSIHIFTKEQLDKIPSDFWNKKPELSRDYNDQEFIAARQIVCTEASQ